MATQAQVDELIAKMTEERDTLLEAVAQVLEADADVRPPKGEGEAGWSVKEQLSHLAEMEVSYRAWVQRALVEDRPDVTEGTTPDPVAVPHSEAHSADLESHVAELRRLREQTLGMLKLREGLGAADGPAGTAAAGDPDAALLECVATLVRDASGRPVGAVLKAREDAAGGRVEAQ